MTEREKMIKVIKKAFEDCGRMLKEQIPRVLSGEIKKASDGTPPLDEAIADALIAAGIGDISEEKHRAEVAEEAFLILWNECKEKLGWNIDCTMWYAKQAEKRTRGGKKR